MADGSVLVPVLDKWRHVLGVHPHTLGDISIVVIDIARGPDFDGRDRWLTAVEECIKAALTRREYSSWLDVIAIKANEIRDERLYRELCEEELFSEADYDQHALDMMILDERRRDAKLTTETAITVCTAQHTLPAEETVAEFNANINSAAVQSEAPTQKQLAAFQLPATVDAIAVGVVSILVTAFLLDSMRWYDCDVLQPISVDVVSEVPEAPNIDCQSVQLPLLVGS